jgi:hypothetical protein
LPFFKCLIRGEHIPGEIIGQSGLYGFYATRWVQALNAGRAELRAIEAVRRDPLLAVPDDVPKSPDARLWLEEIEQVARLPRSRGGGATWFSEDEGEPGDSASRKGR